MGEVGPIRKDGLFRRLIYRRTVRVCRSRCVTRRQETCGSARQRSTTYRPQLQPTHVCIMPHQQAQPATQHPVLNLESANPKILCVPCEQAKGSGSTSPSATLQSAFLLPGDQRLWQREKKARECGTTSEAAHTRSNWLEMWRRRITWAPRVPSDLETNTRDEALALWINFPEAIEFLARSSCPITVSGELISRSW